MMEKIGAFTNEFLNNDICSVDYSGETYCVCMKKTIDEEELDKICFNTFDSGYRIEEGCIYLYDYDAPSIELSGNTFNVFYPSNLIDELYDFMEQL